MRYLAYGCILLLPLVVCSFAGADPSLLGYSGMLYTPTADVLAEGDWNIGANSNEVEDWDRFNYYGNFGLGGNTEVGVLLQRTDVRWVSDGADTAQDGPAVDNNETFLSIKQVFRQPTDGKPGIAAGVFDITDEVQTTVYVLANWQFGREVGQFRGRSLKFLNLNVGFASGQIEDLFFGAQFALDSRIEIMGEHVGDEWNLGARIHPLQGLTVDAGLMDVEDLAVNVSYNAPL